MSGAASARWREPPYTISADSIRPRASSPSPSTPSSPIPTMDNQRFCPCRLVGGAGFLGLRLDMRPHVLILGGTTEARELALVLPTRELALTMSLAGRTAAPAAQPVPVRRGGF